MRGWPKRSDGGGVPPDPALPAAREQGDVEADSAAAEAGSNGGGAGSATGEPEPPEAKLDPKVEAAAAAAVDDADEQPLDKIHSIRRPLAVVLACSWVAWQMYVAGTRPPNPTFMRATHLCFAFTAAMLLFPGPSWLKERRRLSLVFDLVIAAFSVSVFVFLIQEYTVPDFRRLVSPEPIDMAVGAVGFVLILYAVWRTSGLALTITGIVFLAYGFFGQFVPSPVGHEGYSVERIVSYAFFRLEGILGVAVGASAVLIFPVLVFGGFMLALGGGTFFARLALSLIGHVRGGAGKVGVVASGLFATVTGVGAANVATTGVFTIPLMIKSGYKRTTAAAIESSASIGGQILPPVMGAAAFVMAELMGVTYAQIVRHAWLPAMLFFASLYWRAHLEAQRLGLKQVPRSEMPNLRPVLVEGWQFLVALIALIYLLAIRGTSVPRSAFQATALMLILHFGRLVITRKPLELSRIVNGCVLAARSGAVVGTATAAVMIVISMVGLTGIGIKLSSLLIALSGGSLFALLLLTALASIILGTGLPTVPTYLILAVLTAPALQTAGVPLIAAHLFVLYYGTWGDLTPPTALGPTVAAGIAGAPLMRTMIESMRVGLIGLVLPFAFVYAPEMLFIGEPLAVIVATTTAVVGVFLAVIGLAGFFLVRVGWPARAAFLASGVALLGPPGLLTVAGLALGAAALAYQYLLNRRPSRGRARQDA